MSRKNLARTVIEGGRYYSNCYFRRASHGIARARTRDWLDHVADDLDDADATDPRPGPKVAKHFRDKLGPAQRWMEAQVGRPWDKVYSDLRKRFDSRTIAGKHVVDDHLLHMVRRFDDPMDRWRSHALVIDKHGILRKPKPRVDAYAKLIRETKLWTAGRLCTSTRRGWHWVRRVPVDRCTNIHLCSEPEHHYVPEPRYRRTCRYHRFAFHDEGAMTPREVRRFFRLPPELRAKYVIVNPWTR